MVYTRAPERLADDRLTSHPRVSQSKLYEPIYRSTIRFFARHAGVDDAEAAD